MKWQKKYLIVNTSAKTNLLVSLILRFVFWAIYHLLLQLDLLYCYFCCCFFSFNRSVFLDHILPKVTRKEPLLVWDSYRPYALPVTERTKCPSTGGFEQLIDYVVEVSTPRLCRDVDRAWFEGLKPPSISLAHPSEVKRIMDFGLVLHSYRHSDK